MKLLFSGRLHQLLLTDCVDLEMFPEILLVVEYLIAVWIVADDGPWTRMVLKMDLVFIVGGEQFVTVGA